MTMTTALLCLALNVYHEARGDPDVGQYAVAHVVINRVKNDRWPNDICSVVKQGYREGRNDCQFSWYCDGKSDQPYNKKAWAKSQLIASDVLSGTIDDVTQGATHYHAKYITPWWAKHYTKTVSLGIHHFYK